LQKPDAKSILFKKSITFQNKIFEKKFQKKFSKKNYENNFEKNFSKKFSKKNFEKIFEKNFRKKFLEKFLKKFFEKNFEKNFRKIYRKKIFKKNFKLKNWEKNFTFEKNFFAEKFHDVFKFPQLFGFFEIFLGNVSENANHFRSGVRNQSVSKCKCFNFLIFIEIRLFYENTSVILCENIFFLHCADFRKACRKKQSFEKSAEKNRLL
jgi:hypothetical protein